MIDDRLRELERAATETCAPADMARLLAEKVRLGQIDIWSVRFAAWCGDETSRLMLLPQNGMLIAGAGLLSFEGSFPFERVPGELKFFANTGALKVAADAAVAEGHKALVERGGGDCHCEDGSCWSCGPTRRMGSQDDEKRIKAAVEATRDYRPGGEPDVMDGGEIEDQPIRIRAAIAKALVRWALVESAL